MESLYANIKIEHNSQKDTMIRTIIAVLICLFLFMTASIIWFLGYHGRFTKFVGSLSDSTTYAYDNNSLTATVNGKTFHVSAENMYGIFGYLSLNNSGRESSRIPEGEPVTLDYGNGSTLELWDTATERGSHHLFVQFTDIHGKTYSYISYKATLETVLTRYLTYGND